MDDQNNNPGGIVPSEPTAAVPEPTTPVAEPTTPAPEPSTPEPAAPAQKCVTCGNTSDEGNCVSCGLGEATCTCPPASPNSGTEGTQQGSAPIV